jgi:hypothetical protein
MDTSTGDVTATHADRNVPNITDTCKHQELMKKCVVLQVNDAAVSLRLVVFVSKVQRFYIQITVQNGWEEGREERGATPLTFCVGCRSSGQGPPLIPWGEAPHLVNISDIA